MVLGPGESKSDFDVIIIGAGISGICFAHRLIEWQPHLRYCILEGRDSIGGTWSLFQYPGKFEIHTFTSVLSFHTTQD